MSKQTSTKYGSSHAKVTRLKNIDPDEMTKEQLLLRVRQLEANVTNLRNVITKNAAAQDVSVKEFIHKRTFDFNQYNTRHVLLKFAYFGWDYSGYAVQEETVRTIEHELFLALTRTRLIESRQTSNYHRCGRTDRGVSAFSQVISIDLRTNLLEGDGVKTREAGTAHQRKNRSDQELPYCEMLNKVLPANIRMIAWCPTRTNVSARFDCTQRTYKYYFPWADLDLKLMQRAGDKLVGSHDFRNLAKMDVGNGVTTFTRRIQSVTVRIMGDGAGPDDPYTLCELTIVGNAFLWHQVRCIVAVLFMVGRGREQPEIIDRLLDVASQPCKPQYQMASELPLVLYDCQYDGIHWIIDNESHRQLVKSLQHQWTEATVRAAMMRVLLKEVENQPVNESENAAEIDAPISHQMSGRYTHQLDPLNTDGLSRQHRPLLKRQTCESLEERIKYYAKRRKIEVESMSSATEGETSSTVTANPDTDTGTSSPGRSDGDMGSRATSDTDSCAVPYSDTTHDMASVKGASDTHNGISSDRSLTRDLTSHVTNVS